MAVTVSINLCCYNSERYLEETLQSILAQTFKDWELVIVNDGSTDSTETLIGPFIKKGYPIVYYRQENHGLGYSRNEALKRSSGKYIAFIDHDDNWLPKKLETQVLLFDDPGVDLVYSNYYRIDGHGKNRRLGFNRPQPRGYVFRQFLRCYPVSLPTVMVRKSSLERLGSLFDPELNVSEEYDLFMRLLWKGKADYLNTPMVEYRIHKAMASMQKIDRYPIENTYVLQKLQRLIPGFENDYCEELRCFRAKIDYWCASAEMYKGSPVKARRYLFPYRFKSFIFFVMYALTFFPAGLWRYLQDTRNWYKDP